MNSLTSLFKTPNRKNERKERLFSFSLLWHLVPPQYLKNKSLCIIDIKFLHYILNDLPENQIDEFECALREETWEIKKNRISEKKKILSIIPGRKTKLIKSPFYLSPLQREFLSNSIEKITSNLKFIFLYFLLNL